jgi:hypothetical protein
VLVSGVVFKYKGKMPDRPADSNAVEAEAYLSSGPSSDTDINLVLEQLPAVTPEAVARFGAPPADAFTIAPALVQPTSRGPVRLASKTPSLEIRPVSQEDSVAAGVDAKLDVWIGMPHGFVTNVGGFSTAKQALKASGAFLSERLGSTVR